MTTTTHAEAAAAALAACREHQTRLQEINEAELQPGPFLHLNITARKDAVRFGLKTAEVNALLAIGEAITAAAAQVVGALASDDQVRVIRGRGQYLESNLFPRRVGDPIPTTKD